MPLPDDFATESLYAPDHWFVHDLLELDPAAHRLVTRTDTTRLGSLVAAQRPTPNHPKHVPGAIAIQITGTLGALHAIYAMNLRPSLGWAGFGTHIRCARFRKLGTIGPDLIATTHCVKQRQFRGTWFLDYTFLFEQEGEEIYRSEQTAAWARQP